MNWSWSKGELWWVVDKWDTETVLNCIDEPVIVGYRVPILMILTQSAAYFLLDVGADLRKGL